MKIRLIRTDLNAPPGTVHDGLEKRAGGVLFWRAGTVLDVTAREAQLLVGNCDAEPADDEAEKACGDWRQNRARKLQAREMLAKGIQPEDREAYRRGEMVGYDDNGDPIPGPNAVEGDDATDSES